MLRKDPKASIGKIPLKPISGVPDKPEGSHSTSLAFYKKFVFISLIIKD